MSIPKEPRQLMINLMYLVLTALLALNVSAEVMNAFFSLDKGMENSRNIVEKNNESLLKAIDKQAKAYPKPANDSLLSNARQADQIANEFVQYIGTVRKRIYDKAGGDNPKVPGQPKDIRNKDITTRMFVLGEDGQEGVGFEIERKIKETRKKLLDLVDNDPVVAASLPLDVEPLPPGSDKKSWADFKFRQMPVAAIFPILGKIQSDAKNSATAVLNKVAEQIGGVEIRFDEFEPVISAPKGYVISGDKYEADVFLSARSSTANNISISAGGANLPVQEGKGHYTVTTSGAGTKQYQVRISVKNPLNNEVKVYEKTFEYEVGLRSASVQLDKMNVFYIGVDNPITVSAAGISSNDLNVSASGVSLNKSGNSKYIVRATTPGEATITLSGGGLPATRFTYRVKRIPDPVPMLGAKHRSKAMPNGEFRAQGGVSGILENFDFEAKCDVVGFEVTYLPKRQDPISKQNGGARWSGDIGDMIQKAKPGDNYFFDDIKVRCPGDQAARNIGGLAFKIR